MNKQTRPRIDDLFDELQGATVVSSIDMQSAFYQVRHKPEDIPKLPSLHHLVCWSTLCCALA